jgi:plasmid maintenance system antidote protein VapI
LAKSEEGVMRKTAIRISLTDKEAERLSAVCGASPEVVANCRVKNFLKEVANHLARERDSKNFCEEVVSHLAEREE